MGIKNLYIRKFSTIRMGCDSMLSDRKLHVCICNRIFKNKYREKGILLKTAVIIDSCLGSIPLYNERKEPIFERYYLPDGFFIFYASDKGDKIQNKLMKECNAEAQKALKEYKKYLTLK